MGPATSTDAYTEIAVSDADVSSENMNGVFSIVDAPGSTNGWFGIDPTNVRQYSHSKTKALIVSSMCVVLMLFW